MATITAIGVAVATGLSALASGKLWGERRKQRLMEENHEK
jgi:hypothetical protein